MPCSSCSWRRARSNSGLPRKKPSNTSAACTTRTYGIGAICVSIPYRTDKSSILRCVLVPRGPGHRRVAHARARGHGGIPAHSEAKIALETTMTSVNAELEAGSGNYSLCHGLAGNAEIILSGLSVVGGRAFEVTLERCLDRYRPSRRLASNMARRAPSGSDSRTVPWSVLGSVSSISVCSTRRLGLYSASPRVHLIGRHRPKGRRDSDWGPCWSRDLRPRVRVPTHDGEHRVGAAASGGREMGPIRRPAALSEGHGSMLIDRQAEPLAQWLERFPGPTTLAVRPESRRRTDGRVSGTQQCRAGPAAGRRDRRVPRLAASLVA